MCGTIYPMKNKTEIQEHTISSGTISSGTTSSGTISSISKTKGKNMSTIEFKIERNCYWCQILLADHEDYLIMDSNFYCPRCPEYKQEINKGYLKKYPFFN